MKGEIPEQQWDRLQREYQKAVQASYPTQSGVDVPERKFCEIWRLDQPGTKILKRTSAGSMRSIVVRVTGSILICGRSVGSGWKPSSVEIRVKPPNQLGSKKFKRN